MTIRGFGNILPIHGEILSLIGWQLSRGGSNLISSETERVEAMRMGHADLVRTTGQDFGYDLGKWREFLLANGKELGYRHPYAFSTVDRAVRAAIADPDFARLAALAAAGDAKWDARYRAKLERKRQAHLAGIAARDARITDNRCPLCGMPLPRYRVTCKHCGGQVRARPQPRG